MKIHNRGIFFGSVFGAAFFVGIFSMLIFPETASAATIAQGTISQNTVWTAAASPYIVSVLTVNSGVTLTIDPGVIVKIGDGALLNIFGTLQINGTTENKVYFTSYRDDFLGGDTNGDGFLSMPAARDWQGVQFNAGSVGNINGTVIQFAGNVVAYGSSGAGVYNLGGTVNISNSLLLRNYNYGIYQKSGNLILSDSEVGYHSYHGVNVNGGNAVVNHNTVHDNTSYGFYSGIPTALTLTNNTFTNNANAALIYPIANFLHSGNTASGGTMNGLDIYGTVTGDQMWSADSMPYVVTQLIISTGKTVTINPGTVIKFDANGTISIVVDGNLKVNGDANNKVYFTSIKDDSVGGDTNGDGSASTPAAGNWRDIRFSAGASGNFSNAVIHFAGNLIQYNSSASGIYNLGGAVSLTNVVFENNTWYGVWQKSGSLTVTSSEFSSGEKGINVNGGSANVHGSSFHNIKYFAIYNDSTVNVDATNNWWGDDSGPTIAGNPSGHGQRISTKVLYDPWTGKIPLNQAPTLGLATDFVNGISATTTFLPAQPSFGIQYTDSNNDAPAYVRAVVSGTPYALVRAPEEDGNFANGEKYIWSAPTSTFAKGNFAYHFEASDGQATVRWPATGELSFAIKNTPVILIPGIMGTEMKKGDEVLWMNPLNLIISLDDSFMDPLLLNYSGNIIDTNVVFGDTLRKPFPGFDYFNGLINELQLNGYLENNDLFVFPYDWRLDNKINSQKLKDKIDLILTQVGNDKVNIVAHSMGGLIVKQYIVDNGSAKVDKLVFIATPQLGAPKAFKMLMAGDNFDIPLILNQLEMKKLSQNMSSAYQLLPSQKYFDEFGGYFLNQSQTPDNYSDTKNYLLSNQVNAGLLTNAEQFHSGSLDNFSAPNTTIYNIVGCNTPTIGRIIKRNSHILPDGVLAEDYDLENVTGDGTVPLTSALAVAADNRYYVTDAEHSKMPSQDGIRQLVAQIVSGVDSPLLSSNVRTDITKCHIRNGKLISVHSPVDLHVYDAAGNHVGITDNGVIDENIPGATYENIANNKFIFLPEDEGQIYSVKLDATATGSFSFRVSDVSDDQVQKTVYYNDVAITPASVGQMAVSDTSSDTAMQFDAAGTNNFDLLPASSVLGATESQDYVQPSTTIILDGKKGNGDWFTSSVTVALSALDDNSGILNTQYSFDDGANWQNYSVPFVVTQEGTTNLSVRSIDKAGNVEQTHSSNIYIDTTSPEATIVFDPVKKDVSISGVDNLSDVVSLDSGSSFSLTDAAGNVTTLVFAQKDRRHSLRAELTEIWYNGAKLKKMSKNRFSFEWSYDKQNNLKELEQNIMVKKDFSLASEYNAKQNITKIHGKDVDSGKIKQKLNGLFLLKIKTNKGNLNYNF